MEYQADIAMTKKNQKKKHQDRILHKERKRRSVLKL
jgi:hypothetical protein